MAANAPTTPVAAHVEAAVNSATAALTAKLEELDRVQQMHSAEFDRVQQMHSAEFDQQLAHHRDLAAMVLEP